MHKKILLSQGQENSLELVAFSIITDVLFLLHREL